MVWVKGVPALDGLYWVKSDEVTPKLVELIGGEVKVGTWIFEVRDFTAMSFCGPLREDQRKIAG